MDSARPASEPGFNPTFAFRLPCQNVNQADFRRGQLMARFPESDSVGIRDERVSALARLSSQRSAIANDLRIPTLPDRSTDLARAAGYRRRILHPPRHHLAPDVGATVANVWLCINQRTSTWRAKLACGLSSGRWHYRDTVSSGACAVQLTWRPSRALCRIRQRGERGM